MRIVFQRLVFLAAVALAACSDRTGLIPSEPSPGTTGPQKSYVPAVGCTLKTATQIKDELHTLIINTPTSLWPSEQSTFGKINYIDGLRSYSGPGQADSLSKAIVKTKELIDFVTSKYNSISGTTYYNPTNTALLNTITADLYCFVGVSGIFDLNPGDPDKDFKLDGVGGVWFPANVVPVGTTVVLTKLPTDVPLLGTVLDQYASYISIQLIPEPTFTPPNLPIVIVCPLLPDGSPVSDALLGTLLVGAQHAPGEFELLQPAAYPGTNPCTGQVGLQPAPRGWLNGWLARAVDMVLPVRAQASSMFFLVGVGGSTIKFSGFGSTSTTLSASGTGGSTLKFAPPAASSAASSAPANIPPATISWDGVAGTTRTTDLPSIKVETPGGDNIPAGTDGKNPIVGATVTFTIGDTDNQSDTNSNAKFCGGLTQTTVQTNASGVAAVPCIDFGTKAGFANLAAAVDVTTSPDLQFAGANLVVVSVSNNNFLIETKPAAATKIVTFMGAGPTASPSYSYGTAFAEGAAVSPPPQVLVTDQYDNPVGAGVGIEWSPLADANGAVLVPGAAGATTNAQSVATADSWTLGAGAHTLTATIADAPEPRAMATFTASTPTGVSGFACAVGGNKTDIGWMSIPKPTGTVRDITLDMSVTGQASSEATYNATVEVRKNSSTGTPLGGGAGGVILPGNNGSPRVVTLRLSDPVTATEMAGTGPNATNTLWINLTFTNLPGTRKIQVWYNNSITKSNQGPCFNALVYAPVTPLSLTNFKRGLGINVTN